MATQTIRKPENIEAVANSFIKDLIAKGLIEDVRVQVVGDSRESRAAQAADVHAYLKTLDTDSAIRFDVSDDEVADEIVHAEPAPESGAVDIDMDAEPVVLARRRRHHLLYFAGFYKHRSLWTTHARCARVFESEDEVVIEAFQFADDGSVLKEVFQALGLQMIPAPKQPESV